MFFANAVYTSNEYGESRIAISTDEKSEQLSRTTSDGLLRAYYRRPISQAVMKAASSNKLPMQFECNGVKYTLIKYTAGVDERLYNEYRENHVVRKAKVERNKEIYVYSERCRCTSCYAQYRFSSIENLCGIVRLREDPMKTVEIDVQRCKHCDSYFIDVQSLLEYERKYGLLAIHKRHITGNETYEERETYTYADDTVLSRNGYSTKLYTYQRQEILSRLLSRQISSKAEVKDILARFIFQRGDRYPNAKAAWETDLEYVNQYNLEKQGTVMFE